MGLFYGSMQGTTVTMDNVWDVDDVAAMTNPDCDEYDVEQAVVLIGQRFDTEKVKFDHDTYNHRLTLETPTLKLSVRLDDVTNRPKEDTAMLQRKTDDDSRDILLLEGEDAYYAMREALTVKQERQMERDRYDREQERKERHPSLTVGERNPNL